MTASAPIIIPPTWLPPQRRKRIVVGFAGGGGSSIAVKMALGVEPDAALNHWPLALAVHQANNPDCAHFCADIFDTDCRAVLPGEEIGLAWFSPDCRHFSKAKGGAPVSARVRGLAWVVIPWAKLRRPDVIMLENVEEFLTWGPVMRDEAGRLVPDPARRGETFARWKRRLEACGYVVDWKIISAADFGAPTIRKRLFLIARRDGRPIVWPAPTHAPRDKAAARGLKPYRAAAEIIDFSRPCPSIFLTKDEARALRVKRPLEEATLRRIAKGLFRYTIASADPFIVPVTHAGDDRTHAVTDPLRTMTTSPRGEFALVALVITGCGGRMGQTEPVDPRGPYPTITSKNDSAMASAYLVPSYGEREGQEPRSRPVDVPYPVVVPGGNGGHLVSASLIGLAHGEHKDRPGLRVKDPRDPMNVIHAGGGNGAVLAAFMEQANTGMVGHEAREPVSTIVERGATQRLVSASMMHLRGADSGSGDPLDPARTITAEGRHQALLSAHIDTYYSAGNEGGNDAREPVRSATAKARQSLIVSQLSAVAGHGRRPQVLAFLQRFYGEPTEADHADPLASPEVRAKFGIVLLPGGPAFIVDIGMRMLDPETELAPAMGVPAGYVLGRDVSGRPVTKTDVTKMVGNMVSPPPAAALIKANCGDLPWWRNPIQQREAA